MHPMTDRARGTRGYRDLLTVPSYGWLLGAVFLSRLGNAMSQVAVVIYLLERTGSTAIAGMGAAAQLIPAVATGPLIGAWLDRVEARRPLIVWTQLIRAALLLAVVAVGELRDPPAAVYIVLLAGLGLTFPLPNPGFRALVPVIVPRRLWDPANALDSISYDTAFVIGPALAAAIVTAAGAPLAIVAQAGLTVLAALAAWRVREPRGRPIAQEPVLAAAADGLRAVTGHPELRATMALMMVSGIGFGALTIALPVWAQEQLGRSPGASGWMWAALSAGSIAGALLYGALRPKGSDARHAVAFAALGGLPLLVLPFAPDLLVGMICMGIAGLATAPFVISMFAIRQRALPPELHGRAFAITVSINVAGTPIGALLAGFLIGPIGVHSVLFLAGAGQLAAALAAEMVLRTSDIPEPATA
jgi:MFS family permease